jgi:hypothetical protein
VTGSLSALIWNCRLFGLEHALPRQAYLEQQWPGRETYADPQARLQSIRSQYLVLERPSVTSELIDLRYIVPLPIAEARAAIAPRGRQGSTCAGP